MCAPAELDGHLTDSEGREGRQADRLCPQSVNRYGTEHQQLLDANCGPQVSWRTPSRQRGGIKSYVLKEPVTPS